MEPTDINSQLLEEITNGFSEERILGSGAYGTVYKGVHKNGEEIAVKKLYDRPGLDDEQFRNELENLMRLKHPNIVRLVGYCYETQHKLVVHEGKLVFADKTYRALCIEYMHNGSLQNHLSDEYDGLDWHTRYKIIKGTCEGVNYLHEGLKNPIYHLDLKPDNILLDKNMVPKLADFGLSKLFGEEQTRITKDFKGTIGYLPPEYIKGNVVSKKLDIFSLGVVIIKIMTGPRGYSRSDEMSSQQFVELVHENWRGRLLEQSRLASLEVYCQQVKKCIEIALNCVEVNRHNRPNIGDIIRELNEIETMIHMVSLFSNEPGTSIDQISSVSKLVDEVQSMAVFESPIQLPLSELGLLNWYHRQAEKVGKLLRISAYKGPGETSTEVSPASSKTTKLLGIHPLELRFPFEPNKRIPCHLSLTNKTDYFVVFWVTPCCPDRYWKICYHCIGCVDPLQGCQCLDGLNKASTLLPRSTRVITVIMEGQQQPPPDTDNFIVVMVTLLSEGDMLPLSSIGSEMNTEADFFNRVEALGGKAYVAKLTAVVCDPASRTHEIMSTRKFGDLKSIDVHPREPWILTSHDHGYVSIWNYQTQGRVMAVRVTKEAGVVYSLVHPPNATSSIYSAKFIARKEWFVAGDGYGYIHVFGIKKFEAHPLKKFEAHPRSRVYSLAVHPTRQFLLSSSDDQLIKLWDWGNGWVCTRTFQGHTSSVYQVIFNPKHPNTFASAGSDVKIWTIYSSNPNTTFEGRYSVDYYLANSDRQYMITSGFISAYIWDLHREICVHTLKEEPDEWVNVVACHPALPILVTASIDGTVCLWNAINYRLENMVHFELGSIKDLGFINTKDLTRLVVGCSDGIAIMEINHH